MRRGPDSPQFSHQEGDAQNPRHYSMSPRPPASPLFSQGRTMLRSRTALFFLSQRRREDEATCWASETRQA
jgi:hypothetical protein